jgi:hypothetical protein
MAVSVAQAYDLLFPGLRKVAGQYKDIDRIYPKIYKVDKSYMSVERTASMRYLGLAALKNEGGPTTFDNQAGERYVYNQYHKEIGLGYAFTRKMIDDNLYKRQWQPSNLGLQKSFNQTKEIYGAYPLNMATFYDPTILGDQQPLCSLNHPIDTGVVPNRFPVDMDLNEASLLNAQASVRGLFRDNAGLRMQARARKLVVPIALEPVAIRLLKTSLRPGTNDNDVNAIPETSGGIPDGFVVHDYLTSPTAWFLMTDQEGLLYLQRVAFELDMQVDFTSDNLLVKGYERYSFGYFDFRAIWGSFPTQ